MSVPIWDKQHPKFQAARDKAIIQFRLNYNTLSLKNVEQILGYELRENTYLPDVGYFIDEYLLINNKTIEDVRKKYYADCQFEPDDDDLVEYLRDDLERIRDELHFYPRFHGIYEVRDYLEKRWIEANKDELFELGIGVVEQTERYDTMLFVLEHSGEDFYAEYWIPMYCKAGLIVEDEL